MKFTLFFLQLIQHNLVNASSLRKACVAIMQTNRQHPAPPPHTHERPHTAPQHTQAHASYHNNNTFLFTWGAQIHVSFRSYLLLVCVLKALVKFEKLNSSTFKESMRSNCDNTVNKLRTTKAQNWQKHILWVVTSNWITIKKKYLKHVKFRRSNKKNIFRSVSSIYLYRACSSAQLITGSLINEEKRKKLLLPHLFRKTSNVV